MHHAQLLIGSHTWALSHIPSDDTVHSPDVLITTGDKYTITDSRNLIHNAHIRPIEKKYRTFIISYTTILLEAQNALLKLLEEPNEHTRFYLIIPRENILIPTLRSRLHLLKKEEHTLSHTILEDFLPMSYKERLSCIGDILTKNDTSWIETLVTEIAHHAHTTKNGALMEDVRIVEKYIHMNGSSKKMLLEHIALTLPLDT